MSINKYNKDSNSLSLCAGASRIWTGTQAAYTSAMRRNEIPANTIICITDDQTNELPDDVYSTEETKTNKVWIDGKPVYRIVMKTTEDITTSGYTWGGLESKISSLNIETPIQCFGISAGSTTLVSSILFRVSAGFKTLTNTSLDTSGTIVLEYTKTTD